MLVHPVGLFGSRVNQQPVERDRHHVVTLTVVYHGSPNGNEGDVVLVPGLTPRHRILDGQKVTKVVRGLFGFRVYQEREGFSVISSSATIEGHHSTVFYFSRGTRGNSVQVVRGSGLIVHLALLYGSGHLGHHPVIVVKLTLHCYVVYLLGGGLVEDALGICVAGKWDASATVGTQETGGKIKVHEVALQSWVRRMRCERLGAGFLVLRAHDQ